MTRPVFCCGGWHIHGRAGIEEALGFEHEAGVGDGHYGPVLWTGDMVLPEGVPDHDISIGDRPIRLCPLG